MKEEKQKRSMFLCLFFHKKKMRRLVIGLIIAAVVIILAGVFLYFSNQNPKPEGKTITKESLSTTEISEDHIAYVLYQIGASKLKKIPLTGNTPKINFIIVPESYKAEVINGMISVSSGIWENPDIIITSSKEEIINAIASLSIKEYIKSSVSSGKTTIDMKAGYTELFAKGYLSLYEEITGKSLTGSMIRRFSD